MIQKENIQTKEASIGETLLLLFKPPPSKSRAEIPKEEFENLLRFEAPRGKERGHGLNKKGTGRNG